MASDWGSLPSWDAPKDAAEQKAKQKAIPFDEERIRGLLYRKASETGSKICCLIYGSDGTGKSGLVQSYPIAKGDKIVIVDFDGGNLPLKFQYHRDSSDQILVVDPVEVSNIDGLTQVDYQRTMSNVRELMEYIKRHHERDGIKVVVIDGLSSMLKKAEYIMRVEHNLMPDQGVSQRYWISRSKIFEEIIELTKSLPVARFFISHEDFIASPGKDLASVKAKTNQAMFQKIHCVREDKGARIEFKATFDKSKYDSKLEGLELTFLTINKESKEVKWSGEKVIEVML